MFFTIIKHIRTVLINVSRSVDCLGRVQGVFAPPWLVVPTMVMMAMRIVVRTRVSMDVCHYFVRCDQVAVLRYRHTANPRRHSRSIPIRGASVGHQFYCNCIRIA